MKSMLYLLLISFVFFTGCVKDKNYEFVEMEFELPATMTPERDTIDLGDTLLFKMDFSDSLKDAKSGITYKIKNFPFNLFLSATKIDDSTKGLGYQVLSTHKFTYTSLIGNFVNTGRVATHFKLQYSTNNYQAICKIKPNETGVFVFDLVYMIPKDDQIPDSILSLPISPNGKRQIPYLRIPKFIFNNGNTNFSLLRKNCIVAGDSTRWSGFYTFYVR